MASRLGISTAVVVTLLCGCILSPPRAASQAQTPDQGISECTFEDGKQISIRYHTVSTKEELPKSSVWKPGGFPMYLFSQTNFLVGGREIPAGAYSLYVIPAKDKWTLIINKNVAPESKYDEQQDVVRVPMDTAEVGQPVDRFQVAFGRVAPTQCNLRFYYAKIGVYGAELDEK